MTPNQAARTSVALLSALGLALVTGGCAEERDPINRVQPYALEKSHYVGAKLLDPSDDPEFYLHTTLVDVGYGAYGGMFTSTYAQPVARMKWVIEEDYLLGRLTYERIADSDGKGTAASPNEGQIVVRFKILKHFDIKRAYNSTTGEEMNIIEENSSDRHWYDRQYFRVDWSQNLITDSYDFDMLSLLGVISGVKYLSHPYYVNDPTHEHAPKFDLDTGYFDVTTKAFAQPQQINLSRFGYGNMPACLFSSVVAGGTSPVGNCNPIELTIRHSFLKVEDRDYQPADWDGYRFQAVGTFVTERMGYARNYGMTDDRHYRLVNRFNIWDRSHYYDDPVKMTGAIECFVTPGIDPNRDLEGGGTDGNRPDGTADECEAVTEITGVGGSQCDTFTQKCTLPYRLRKIRPNPWFYTSGSNLDYFEPTRDAVVEWDAALRFAVQAVRYAECTSTAQGDKATECRKTYPVPFGQQDENQDLINLVREVEDCKIGAAYRGEDCDAVALRLNQKRGYSPGVYEIARSPNILALCNSPVEHNDPKICGGPRLPQGTTAEMCEQARQNRDTKLLATCNAAKTARIGDLRYHQVNVIKAPQSDSPWGIMVDAHDPMTGEKLAASANVWSHATDAATQGLVDMARYAKGELETREITDGEYIMDWSDAAKAAKRGGVLRPMSKAEVDQRLAGVVGVDVEKFHLLADQGEHAISKEAGEALVRELQGIRTEISAPSAMRPKYEARRKAAMNTWLEAELTTPMMQQLVDTTAVLDPELQEQFASPFRGANPTLQRDLRNLREIALAERGACMLNESPSPLSISNLSDVLERKFGAFNKDDTKAVQLERAEGMRKFLAYRFHHAVMAHEMGHSVSLRHNFVSSSDPYGYRPQYWQLRTENKTRQVPCTDIDTPAGCIGPRYWDPVTEEQSDQLIQMFMHSSVMDYPGDLIQDMVGLGIYDFAAARMIYGDLTSVHTHNSYMRNSPRGDMLLDKMDNFGGILGWTYIYEGRRIHYSGLDNALELISDCKTIVPSIYEPAAWNEELLGPWDPLLDGFLVKVNGEYTRCKQQEVDYIPWTRLQHPEENEGSYRAGPSYDLRNRIRVPYGFATDGWADHGNVTVYRHDNGADIYEFFDFLVTQQEMNHIFDNYRRNRLTFNVRGAANRTLGRYNEKLRDAAKGLGLYSNIYRELSRETGLDFNSVWSYYMKNNFAQNALASTLAFDHFTRQMQRPQPGLHFQNPSEMDGSGVLLRSREDSFLENDREIPSLVTIPNGASSRFGNVTFGGKPMENRLARNKGEFDSRYTLNAGAYYDKAYAAILMTESYDNFISSSRTDFLDTRHRAVSMADLFPDGYRRWLASNLTGDEFLKGTRIVGLPSDAKEPPASGIGWISWTPADGPEICYTGEDSLLCSKENSIDEWVLESQVGWEQQKFLIAWTLMYLPENAKQFWLNQMRIWEMGVDNDPGFESRIEFHDPEGRTYVARTFGKEELFGKTVQKGVAARILEYANEILEKAYEVVPVDHDGDGEADWYEPVYGTDGNPIVKFDPGVQTLDPNDRLVPIPPPADCNETDNSGCVCEQNRFCQQLRDYTEVPFFLRQAMHTYSLGDPSMKGVY